MKHKSRLDRCKMCNVTIDLDDTYTPYHNIPGVGICCDSCEAEASSKEFVDEINNDRVLDKNEDWVKDYLVKRWKTY